MTATDTTTTTSTDAAALDLEAMTAAIDAHLVAYGDPDATRRARAVASVWASDGSLIAPPAHPPPPPPPAPPAPPRRARAVASVWASDGSLIDPPIDGTGHAAIAAL